MQTLIDLLDKLEGVLGIIAVVIGSIVAGWFSMRQVRQQAVADFDNQLRLLRETHQHELTSLRQQQELDAASKQRQYAESDKADRLVVLEYLDMLLPRLVDLSTLRYFGADNRDEAEGKRYSRLKHFMLSGGLDAAHPERNLAMRMCFLLLQICGAMRIALNARWLRPMSVQQENFLAHWERHIEPSLCSGRYPGDEFLYREQLEVATEEMIVLSAATGVRRPRTSKEFSLSYNGDETFREIVDTVVKVFRVIFSEDIPLPPRKAMQCRFAILGLYLIRMADEAGNPGWKSKEKEMWDVVTWWYDWQRKHGQSPAWFVFERNDVEERIAKDAANNRVELTSDPPRVT